MVKTELKNSTEQTRKIKIQTKKRGFLIIIIQFVHNWVVRSYFMLFAMNTAHAMYSLHIFDFITPSVQFNCCIMTPMFNCMLFDIVRKRQFLYITLSNGGFVQNSQKQVFNLSDNHPFRNAERLWGANTATVAIWTSLKQANYLLLITIFALSVAPFIYVCEVIILFNWAFSLKRFSNTRCVTSWNWSVLSW